jgi:hypothetical protein
MSKKLDGKPLAKFEAERDVWQEVLEGVREIKAGGGKRTIPKSSPCGASVTVEPGVKRSATPGSEQNINLQPANTGDRMTDLSKVS